MDCNLGSEIGQKMRSAVKAKLLELGTGGSSGFIDDELPDYVMVMVANKRTKQQMNAELNLFLGDQTDLFVTWLHEVLQKLQEVTLPASSANKKRKTKQPEVLKAKDKKSGKKDKKGYRKSGDDTQVPAAETTATTETLTIVGSITDVFAEELLEKAKKNYDVDTTTKDAILLKKRKRKSGGEFSPPVATAAAVSTQVDDVPANSEISSTTSGNAINKDDIPGGSSGNREKDLAELAEIQKKIYAAKQHLRKIGELDDEESNDDENFDLNPNEQDWVSTETVELPNQTQVTTRKVKSPIIFNRHKKTPEHVIRETDISMRDKVETPRERTEPMLRERAEAMPRERIESMPPERNEAMQREPRTLEKPSEERRSVHDRLGIKPQQLERAGRVQKELYIPTHRRRNEAEADKPIERGRERGQRERSRERRLSRERRDNSRDAVRSRRSPRDDRHSSNPQVESSSPGAIVKQRIGSRVIVALNKPPEPSDDEDILDKPVNSIIKIKPRPQVSPRRQASKNLLMRAVADAQRSTILAKPVTTPKKHNDDQEIVSCVLGKRALNNRGVGTLTVRGVDRERELKRAKRSTPTNELFRRTTRELVVNAIQSDGRRRRRDRVGGQLKAELVDEEYVPALSVEEYSAEQEVYVPQIMDELEIDMHINDEASTDGCGAKTQFVVTLNGDKPQGTYRGRSSTSRKRTPSPAQVSSSSSHQMGNSTEPSSTTLSVSRRRRPELKSRERNSSQSSTTSVTPSQGPRNLQRSEIARQQQEIKKIIIKNDTDEDDDLQALQAGKAHITTLKRTATKGRSSGGPEAAASANGKTPITDNKMKAAKEDRSTTPPLPPRRSAEKRAVSHEIAAPTVSAVTKAAAAEPPAKNKHTPIRFTLRNDMLEPTPVKKRRSNSHERDQHARDSSTERRKISIRTLEDKKYDNLPALSAVSVDSAALKVAKPKERCKYHPNCNKQFCDYYHPTSTCKAFPNCKFADKCMYSHPKCKFDLACMSVDCNFAHSAARDLSHAQLSAPPLSSHVIPVQNYKSISAPVTTTTATTMCKYYPNCTKAGCTFYHPKPCRYGKNCINKLECIFYHPEMQSKFKWVASLG